MPFQIIKADILSVRCDAIINPTDEWFSGSGGLDEQIHRAAGSALKTDCSNLDPLKIGEASLTPSHQENCRYIIHTAAPWWLGKGYETEGLRQCYRSCLKIVAEQAFETIAFPLIGSGTRGFPKEMVLRIATEEIAEYLAKHEDIQIILVIHDRAAFQPDPALLSELQQYIYRLRIREKRGREQEFNAVQMCSTEAFPAITEEDVEAERKKEPSASYSFSEAAEPASAKESLSSGIFHPRKPRKEQRPEPKAARPGPMLPFVLFQSGQKTVLDESFSEMMLRKIDEEGFRKDSDFYKKANITKQTFSRMKSADYHPKKATAVAVAIALELSLDETDELLRKAGYSLSHSILFDVIIEYCIMQRYYDIFKINELLFYHDQALLGG